MSPAKTAEPIDMPFEGTDSGMCKEPCVRWGRDPRREGHFWGLNGPLKSTVKHEILQV